MPNAPRTLSDELTRSFRWIMVICALLAVGIVYMEWRFDDRLRYRAPQREHMQDVGIEPQKTPLVPAHRQVVYVPAYSHVYYHDGRPLLLTVTLSVRNTDRDHEIALVSVRYYDSRGREVRSHLDTPLRLGPLATTEFLIERDDTSGGSSASFIVEWVAKEKVIEPIIETVMIDTERRQGISFARRGVVVANAQNDDITEQSCLNDSLNQHERIFVP